MGNTYWQRLRGITAHCMIDDDKCMEYDVVMIRVVPKTVLYDNDSGIYTCMLCGRMFDSYKSVFYHLLVFHSYEIDYWLHRYLVEKYRLLGWLYD